MIARLSRADYPNIDSADVGKYPNVGYGSLESVSTHAIVGGAVSLLDENITATDLTFDVTITDGFPATPFTVQIQEERMRVTSVAGLTFTVTRGYGSTEPAYHNKNKTIFEVRTEYHYLVANHPVKSISAVYIDSQKQDATKYTAYTGKTGDEHASYPDKAVIVFTAEAFIAPQYNVEFAADKDAGENITAVPEIYSHNELQDGNNPNPVTVNVGAPVWIVYGSGYGTINKQTYTATITNVADDDVAIVTIAVTENNILKANEQHTLLPSGNKTINIERSGGIWDDEFKILCQYGSITVTGMTKATNRRTEKYLDSANNDSKVASYRPPKTLDKFQGATRFETQRHGLTNFATYPDTSKGVIISQEHFAQVEVGAGAGFKCRICAVNPATNEAIAFKDYEFAYGVSAPAPHNLYLKHVAGEWDTMTVVVFGKAVQGINVVEGSIYKQVNYRSPEQESAATFLASSSARVVVGDDITVAGDFAVDEDGNYGGAGTLIERPDWVIKHFLVNQMGFALGDIDSTSFTTAGASFASAISGGYKFGFVWSGEDIKRMAFESRSTLNFKGGQWVLNYLPDTAPSVVKTISSGDLAGEGSMFIFSNTPVVDIQNSITAKFKRVNSSSEYLLISRISDSASISKYGTYPADYVFNFITLQAVADSVLAHILKEKKIPLKYVQFPLFFEHFDLRLGDTFDIENPLWTGKKFYIENMQRDSAKVLITAKEWW